MSRWSKRFSSQAQNTETKVGILSKRVFCSALLSVWGFAVVSLVAGSACRLERAIVFPTVSASASAARLPDGVAIDLKSELPLARESGQTNEGILPLKEPPDVELSLDVVRAFFRAVAHEDMPSLRAILSSDASLGPVSGGTSPAAESQWERRFRKLDYNALGSGMIYRDSQVELYRFHDLDEVEGERPSRPAVMSPGDVLVRVPIEIRKIGNERLFGEEILFIVRRTDAGLRVKAILEDFQAP
jgi:ketosteroid isomerase-like protein